MIINTKKLLVLDNSLSKKQLNVVNSMIKEFQIEYFDFKVANKMHAMKSIVENITNDFDGIFIGEIELDEAFAKFYSELNKFKDDFPIIPISQNEMTVELANVNYRIIQKINKYILYGDRVNLVEGFRYIGKEVLGINFAKDIQEPERVVFDGIYHPEAKEVFNSLDEYIVWNKKMNRHIHDKCVGLVFHRSNWLENQLTIIDAIIEKLEALNIFAIPVFNYGSSSEDEGIKNFDQVVKSYFSTDSEIVIDFLINMHMILDKKNNQNIFESNVEKFSNFNIPVARPIVSYLHSYEDWVKSEMGLSIETSWSFTVPERQGMIEPIIIGFRDEKDNFVPVTDRIDRLCNRINNWITLRELPKKDKKIALCIHNAPCSGVEATIGLAYGLDVFNSTINILLELKKAGYYVDNIPDDGKALYEEIMSKKAYADFRWTTVEDIVEHGGSIYKMPLGGEQGYFKYYNELNQNTVEQIEEMWGKPPGQGMVLNNELIITGIEYGNVLIFVQPKRGCYGSKCTGEVCKILHDPSCPPPHQYIATYRYIQDIFKANAIIDVGAGGSLELLPGKSNALSSDCYSDIVIGDTPHGYLYCASSIPCEGIEAKRRSYAVITNHLESAFNTDNQLLSDLKVLNEYLEEASIGSLKTKKLIKNVEKVFKKHASFIDNNLSEHNKEYYSINNIKKLSDYLTQSVVNTNLEVLHTFGKVPEKEELISIIKEIIIDNSIGIHKLREETDNEVEFQEILYSLIETTISNQSSIKATDKVTDIQLDEKILIDEEILNQIKEDILVIYTNLLNTKNEISSLLNLLDGKYIKPGPSGEMCENGRNIIPTGRNLYLLDTEKIPTKSAYEVGQDVVNQMLNLYLEEENEYPEKIAMNMISVDISLAKGEQLSQILYLLGVKPKWSQNGKVEGIEVIPLEELKRPRIDVTVRISGVLRDSYPEIIEYVDEAITTVSSLDESTKENYVKKHSMEIIDSLKKTGEEVKDRSATMRIFGDRPGTYGAGVDLALKASAWNDDEDLAKVFIEFSSYAYGKDLNGNKSVNTFIENIKNSDISYSTTNSKRNDILSSCFYASVSGGINAVKNVLTNKEIKQYHSSPDMNKQRKVKLLSEEIKESLNNTFYSPYWKESMKNQGKIGATELMRRMQIIFDYQATLENIADSDLDYLVDSYLNDKEMKEWFKENNIYSYEEITRRFLELYQRKKWDANLDTLNNLRLNYVSIEGDMEEKMENSSGEYQGGDIEILTDKDIELWSNKLEEVTKSINK